MKKLLLVVAILLAIVGCVTTKDKNTEKNIDYVSKDSLVTTVVDSIKKVYEEKYKELGFYIDFYNSNKTESEDAIREMQDALYDSAVASDSLRKMIKAFKCPESTIRYNTDGSVEVTGKIKTLSGKILELQKSLDSARIKTEKKADIKIKEYTKTVTVTKTKKTIPTFVWFMPLLFYVLGWKFPPSKLLPAIKKKLPWV